MKFQECWGSCQKTIYQISEGVQYDILVKKVRSRVCIAALDVGQTMKIEKKSGNSNLVWSLCKKA